MHRDLMHARTAELQTPSSLRHLMPEVAGRLTESKRVVSLLKLTKSLEANFWKIKDDHDTSRSQRKTKLRFMG